jgi:hypothetical protein
VDSAEGDTADAAMILEHLRLLDHATPIFITAVMRCLLNLITLGNVDSADFTTRIRSGSPITDARRHLSWHMRVTITGIFMAQGDYTDLLL